MNILVTGGLGFIGFNAVTAWKNNNQDLKIVVVDCETYAAKYQLETKKRILKELDIPVEYVDIANPTAGNYPTRRDVNELEEIIKCYNIDTIVNFAAESHVDNSISSPLPFFKTNIFGTIELLELARKFSLRYHQVSTDEVYGITTKLDCITTESTLKPSSPYSSSKASADLIALSYYKTYGTKVTVSRCCNNFGPWQHPEKLIPKAIKCLLNNEKIPVYGNGKQRRQWISAEDHNNKLLDIIRNGTLGKIYNISNNSHGYMANIDILHLLCDFAEKPYDCIEYVADRPGHDTSYYIYDYSRSVASKDEIIKQLRQTFDWYKAHYEGTNK